MWILIKMDPHDQAVAPIVIIHLGAKHDQHQNVFLVATVRRQDSVNVVVEWIGR